MTGPLLPGDPERLGSVRLLGRLGAGGMGTVYLGRTPGGLTVAVKTVHEHLAAEPHFRERFRREAAAARAVTGAHTAAVLDADPESARPWLATAYLPGVTLRHAVAATGPLEPPAVRSLGAALAEALTDIHGAGLVHRDLKPSNVLITADGPRVIDFGIARAIGDHGLTGAGDVIGTPGFIAPEQITGAIVTGAPRTRGAVTGAADVFALGAVLVFAATGRSPFGSATGAVLLYRAVHEDPDLTGVPEEVRELAAACLEKDPGRRPTVAEVLDTAADPGAPLWWRAEPLRSLVLGETAAPGAPAATDPTDPTAATVRGPAPQPRTHPLPSPPLPSPPPPTSAKSVAARREFTRRGLLLAGGGGVASLLTYALMRGGGEDDGKGGEETADPLAVRRGSVRQGAVRWTLAPADAGATVDALRLAGSSLLVHGVGTLDMSDIGGGRGYVTARGLPDAGRRWVTGAAETAPTQWGVSGSVLAAADLGLDAVDLATGEPHDTQERLGVPLWFSVADGVLISAYDEDTRLPSLQAVDLASGEERWTEDVPGTRPAAVLGRTVLLADEDGSYIRCADAVSGRIRWRYEGFEGPVAALAAVPEAGCFALLSTGGTLHFVHARDGGRLATATLEGGASAGSSALAAVGSTVLLATGGRVHAYAPATGAPLWSVRTVGLDTSWPAVTGGGRTPVTAGGALLHWARAGQLQCVGLRSGEERWTARLDGVAQVPPVAVAGTVYAATGELCRALDLNGGAVQHSWDAADIRDLAADRSGWYARLGTATVRAYNHTAVTAPAS
ncbi:Serine/threonine protein kinase [Streptomyces sp. ScaeMP-e48]|uniref:protein kinase domain-containing protein n=1 Tax=Streptomyces sp. ScaeMP-e48 TaxID=1100823 RepID=UPI000823DA48|nr:protein kinase [Streptomyces sp. ScaeMP-e48]SCK49091.1 Serine/threonine protein kinase [Streptomyces sp. ScaeMP-e48]